MSLFLFIVKLSLFSFIFSLFKFCRRISVIIAPKCVFPVPGGPWIKDILSLSVIFKALNWDSSNKFLISLGYSFLSGLIIESLYLYPFSG